MANEAVVFCRTCKAEQLFKADGQGVLKCQACASRGVAAATKGNSNRVLLAIVLSVVALGLTGAVLWKVGILSGFNRSPGFAKSKNDIAGLAAKKFATEAYPLWQSSHAGKQCPDKLDDLNEWAGSKDGKDPWGQPYTMLCGPDAPAPAKGFGVVSAGEDRTFGTPDDIKSWDQ